MILRFEVDQAEAFRQGVNVPKSTNHLEIDPSKLSQEERNLIADRLRGIDVLKIEARRAPPGRALSSDPDHSERIIAKLPSFDSLMEAIREDERRMGIGEQTRSHLRKLSSLIGIAVPSAVADPRLGAEQLTAVETFMTQIQEADENVVSIAAQTNPRGAETFLRLAVAAEQTFTKDRRLDRLGLPEAIQGLDLLVAIVQTYLRELRLRAPS